MTASRTAHIPAAHTIAELTVAPLASEASLRLALTHLDPRLGNGSPTAELWREAERATLSSFPSFSVDEALTFRDWRWFRDHHSTKPIALTAYLRSVAENVLQLDGHEVVPRLPDRVASTITGAQSAGAIQSRARRFFRWLSFAIPPDLLIAALPNGGGHTTTVRTLSPTLHTMLADRGYSETHLHVGAAIDFPLLWITALRAITDKQNARAARFHSPGASFNEGRDLLPWLIRAALARILLARYLAHRADQGWNTLDDYLALRETIVDTREQLGESERALLAAALRELATGCLHVPNTSIAALQDIYARLSEIHIQTKQNLDDLDQAYRADPIEPEFPSNGHDMRSSEMGFIAESLSYMEGPGRNDQRFACLFWQTTRVRNLFYRHIVQRPMTPGLQWFIRFYSRISPSRRGLSSQALFESAARIEGWNQGLKSLEFRTSPDPSQSSLFEYVRTFADTMDTIAAAQPLQTTEIHIQSRQHASLYDLAPRINRRWFENAPPQKPPEVGMVLHFAKDRGGGAMQGRPQAHGQGSNADPSADVNAPGHYRYAGFYRQRCREAMAFAWVLIHRPLSLEYLRGLDVCTDETGIPTWIIAPLYRYVREAGRLASTGLQIHLRRSVPPLRATAHAGEDFVHLLGGLRRVDEALTWLKLEAGDRLGHAVALGMNPERWAKSAGTISSTREERLFNLTWEWNFYEREHLHAPGDRGAYLLREIQRLTDQIFEEPFDAYEVARFVELLHDELSLRRLGFPHGPQPELQPPPPDPSDPRKKSDPRHDRRIRGRESLLRRYLCDPVVFRRGRDIVLVDPAFEAEALTVLQRELRKKVGRLGVTVEVNPSSNLLIGNLADLEHHPLWRLRHPRGDGDAPPVGVCIGSDDPITFATSIRDEYQLVYDTLKLAELSDVEALRWIKHARQAGLDSRFTVPRTGHDLSAFDWEPPTHLAPAPLF